MRGSGTVRVLAGVLVVAACSHDGRDLAPASPDQTQSIVDPTTTMAPDPSGVPLSLAVTVGWTGEPPGSPELAVDFSCDGTGGSPEVRWSGVPASAVEMAVAMVDLDAGGYIHWVVGGLEPLGFIPAGGLPPTATTFANDAGTVGWTPPCPPPGGDHRYQLTVYALARRGLGGTEGAGDAIEYLDGDAIATADVVVRYAR